MTSKSYFDAVANDWDALRSEFFPETVRESALAAARVEPGQLAGDFGAGTGFISEALAQAGLNVIAVDQSEEMLRVLSERLGTDRIEGRVGTDESLPIEDGTLDRGFANMYLHHVEDPSTAIREMARTLKPGGKLVITDLDSHDFEFLVEEHHDRWMGFDRADLVRWFQEASLTDVRISAAGDDCTCSADSECGTQQAEISIFLAVGTKA